jgi:hypothetical protein
MSRINRAWHEAHRLGAKATLEERIAWHLAHAQACACREMPGKIREAIERRGSAPPERGP